MLHTLPQFPALLPIPPIKHPHLIVQLLRPLRCRNKQLVDRLRGFCEDVLVGDGGVRRRPVAPVRNVEDEFVRLEGVDVLPPYDEVGQHAGGVVEAAGGGDVLAPFYGRVDGVGSIVDRDGGGVAGAGEGEEVAALLGGDYDIELGVLWLLVVDCRLLGERGECTCLRRASMTTVSVLMR